ncbi:MAG: sulfotransferase family protein [Pseudomonadota bacterium]
MLKDVKVFGIGFHKTATTSLSHALRHLGYQVTGPNHVKDADIAETYLAKARAISKEYDAFQDNPWPLVYKEMDQMWPNSKFILTVRDPDKWLKSQLGHFAHRVTPMRKLIYGDAHGCPAGNEARYVQVFNDHNAAVRSYFAGREGDLLEIDLTQSPDWDVLCDFLGVEAPSIPFPHRNPASRRQWRSKLSPKKLGKLYRKITGRPARK